MTRRNMLHTSAASLSAAAASAAPGKPAVLQLLKIRLRTNQDNQRQRMTDFLKGTVLPACERVGIRKVGFFQSSVAPDTPFLLTLLSYPSLAAMEESQDKLAADKGYLEGRAALDKMPGLSYVRLESTLMRGFATMPDIEVPPVVEGKPPRLFELRTYESNNATTLARKIKMFDEGEIALFRKIGLMPVFFGQTIIGTNMPNLTYMVAFDDLASREKNWRTFATSPEWQKLRSMPGFGDGEIVSNISNILVQALPFSPVR